MEDEDAMSDNSVPFGYGASAFGSEAEEDEDAVAVHRELALHYIAGQPATESYDVERAASPASSYESMHSDDWGETGAVYDSQCKILVHRQDSSGSSCCSLFSDEEKPDNEVEEVEMMEEIPSDAPPLKPELVIDPNKKRHPALTVDFTSKVLQQSLDQLGEERFRHFKRILWKRYPDLFMDHLGSLDIIDLVDKMLEICDLEVSLKITLSLLNEMKSKYIAEQLEGMCKRNEVRYELKKRLRGMYEHVSEDSLQQNLFENVCTDLYVTDGSYASVNSEHEFSQIKDLQEDSQSNKNPLSMTHIFNPKVVAKRHIRTVIIKGGPGTGKSFLVQKFILDWVEGRLHQDIFFLLPLPFKELNQVTEEKVGFMDLICRLYPEMKEVDNLEFEGCQLMFICDGFDEYTTPIDFRNTACWCDHIEPAKMNVLIANLIRGNIWCSAYVWVITRPVAINRIPAECIHQVLEVRGFSNEQREAYFRKTIPDKRLAERVVDHIKSCKTLFIMCHLPLFCRVVGRMLEKDLQSGEQPKALTHLYTNLLLLLIKMRGHKLLSRDPDFFMKLGKMAFHLLEENVFRIKKEHWNKFGLGVEDAVVTSGLCTQYYSEAFMMYQEKVDCFIHPTVQEYLAALYVFLSFTNDKKNVLEGPKLKMYSGSKVDLVTLYKGAVDKALQTHNGNYNLFLRFLLGMSVEANQELLSMLFKTKSKQQAQEETAHYIKTKIKEHPEKMENLQRCLDELFPHTQRR